MLAYTGPCISTSEQVWGCGACGDVWFREPWKREGHDLQKAVRITHTYSLCVSQCLLSPCGVASPASVALMRTPSWACHWLRLSLARRRRLW